MRTRFRVCFVLLLTLSGAGCLGSAGCDTTSIFQGNPDDAAVATGDLVESPKPLKDVTLDALWNGAEQVLGMEGYQIDQSRTRYDEREMVTHWNTLLAPTRYEGKRHRAVVRFRQNAEGEWIVGVAVQVQKNTDINAPSNAANAHWEDMKGNENKANVLLWRIESGYREPGGDSDEKTK